MSATACRVCDKALNEGDVAWAEDWKVIDTSGDTAPLRNVVRYVCDACEGARR